MDIQFTGAAREVTGSCHIVRANGKTVMLDCGMFQGKRSESREKNLRLPLPPTEIDAIVLSHAHIDHAGRLPLLVREGYRGSIWCTSATRDLCAIMLADSAYIQEKDAVFLAKRRKEVAAPLYTTADAVRAIELMVGVGYKRWMDIVPGIRAQFWDAGHILGSASVVLEVTENGTTKRLVFSGDVGRDGLAIIRDPEPPTGGADAVIMESTYGTRDHVSVDGARAQLAEVVRQTAARGGRLLVPAFALGRTQELVYDLHSLVREGAIPSMPIFIDSPLAIHATTVFAQHPEVFDRTEDLVQQVQKLFEFPLVKYTRDVQESKAIMQTPGPMIIIAASGMVESGRILHHLLNHASDPSTTILIVGFQAEHTLGRRIVDRSAVIKVFGEEVPLRARVEILNGYSAHADRTGLVSWLQQVTDGGPAGSARAAGTKPPVFLVHGEPEVQDAFVQTLGAHGFAATCPEPMSTHSV